LIDSETRLFILLLTLLNFNLVWCLQSRHVGGYFQSRNLMR